MKKAKTKDGFTKVILPIISMDLLFAFCTWIHKDCKLMRTRSGFVKTSGAYKLGGGCLGTIVVFIIIWVLLGKCN